MLGRLAPWLRTAVFALFCSLAACHSSRDERVTDAAAATPSAAVTSRLPAPAEQLPEDLAGTSFVARSGASPFFVPADQAFVARLARGRRVVWKHALGQRVLAVVPDERGSAYVAYHEDDGTRLARLESWGDIAWSRELAKGRVDAFLAWARPSELVVATAEADGHRSTLTWWDRDGAEQRRAMLPSVRVTSLAADRAGRLAVGGAVHGKRTTALVVLWLDDRGAATRRFELGVTEHIAARVSWDDDQNLIAVATLRDPQYALPNVRLVKLGLGAEVLWDKRLRFDVFSDEIALDPAGVIVIGGSLSGAVDFGANVVRGHDREFFAAFAPDGNPLWADGERPPGCVLSRDRGGRLIRSATPDANSAVRGWPRTLCDEAQLTASARIGLAKPRRTPEPVQSRRSAIYQRFSLDSERHGIDGTLQVLQDARIHDRSSDWGCFGWDPLTGGLPGFDTPPLETLVRLVASDGSIVGTLQSGAAYASIEVWKLQGDERKTYALRRLRPVCRSRWTHDLTTLLEVRDGRLQELRSLDAAGNGPKRIELFDGMMAGFRLTAARDGPGRDILSADSTLLRCRNFESCQPLLTRFAWKDGAWMRHERVLEGEGWFGEAFPRRDEFP